MACMESGQRLLHVKPEHLEKLRTPHDFFKAAYRAGFRTVVASFRENQLARDVSSFKHLNRDSTPLVGPGWVAKSHPH
eukprot:Skav222955  [mRNA]  locus=scaffold1489:728397:729569:- [translate_table: standard]